MRPASFLRALGLALGASLAVFGCVIDELKYDPTFGPPGAGTDPNTCAEYCAIVQANCTGDNRAYVDEADCNRICSLLPSGKGDEDLEGKNSVRCRQEQAEKARAEPRSYCPSAGPTGATNCGGNCESYCWLRAQLCSSITGQDTDMQTCLAQCPGLINAPPYAPDSQVRGQDTIQCRINHLVNASQSDAFAERHCWHTSIAPDRNNEMPPPCADLPAAPGNCDSYCDLVMFSCGAEELRVYESVEQCKAVCKAFPVGVAADTGYPPNQELQNTVGCRRYHAYAALGGAQTHCPHAGPMGDGHCGVPAANNCQSYCRLLKRGCGTRFFTTYLPVATPPTTLPDNPEQDDDLGTCEQTCMEELGGMPGGGGTAENSRYSIRSAPTISADDDADNDAGDIGDVLQCRAYYAVQAIADASGIANPGACDAAFGAAPCQ
jgi:hypothetical protein